jgi:uncharacterized membrane protein
VTERGAGHLLLAGVLVAAVCLLAGLLMWMTAAPSGRGLMDAGLIILMATPVLRVLLAAVDYARARDWVFAAVAVAVLAILIGSAIYSRSV